MSLFAQIKFASVISDSGQTALTSTTYAVVDQWRSARPVLAGHGCRVWLSPPCAVKSAGRQRRQQSPTTTGMLRVTGTRLMVTRLSTVAAVAGTLQWPRVSVNVWTTRSECCVTGQWPRCYATAIGQQRRVSHGSRRPDLSPRSRWRTALAVGTAFGTYGVWVALARLYSLAASRVAIL